MFKQSTDLKLPGDNRSHWTVVSRRLEVSPVSYAPALYGELFCPHTIASIKRSRRNVLSYR
jgi:hypothetical protein